MGRKGAIAIALVVVAVGLILGAALIQQMPKVPPNENGVTTIANSSEPPSKQVINVASPRSAFPFMQHWVSQYNNNENAAGSVELGYYAYKPDKPSDLLVVGELTQVENSSRIIPVSAQSVAVVYNIPSFPDIPSGMKLNASLLLDIFNGTVTKWNDQAIKSLNQDLNLPDERIIVVHENGNSSSLSLLDKYLSTDIKWPRKSVGVLGPDELASTVRKTPYSIGYVDFSYATQTRMTFASIGNSHGSFVLPSTESIKQVLNSSMQVHNVTSITGSADLRPPFLNESMLGNNSYPITGLYYVSIPDDIGNDTKNATLDFVKWMIDKDGGQQALSEVQYPQIYQDNQLLTRYSGTAINSTFARASKS